jgi:hypothetical protein
VAVAKAVQKCQDTKLVEKIRIVRCEVCRGLNAVDDLACDCDTFDDDVANASCP